MSNETEINKRSVKRLYELLNASSVEAVADLVSEHYTEHDPLPGQGGGRNGARPVLHDHHRTGSALRHRRRGRRG